ncbi:MULTISPECIES: hypothetical protein [unclassified Streptomyces]|uniref:hypothetical protein n=1 Tax=unclassified Streptomyces TaxID=2593676 RepID=UPI0011B0E02D|nr:MULTISPECIES: hypothetical protein [unclassified Streptomyces]
MKRFTQHPLTGVSDATTGRIPGFGTASANEMVKINEALWKEHETRKGRSAAEAGHGIEESTRTAIMDAYTRTGNVVYDQAVAGTDFRAVQQSTKSKASDGFDSVKSSHEYWNYR